MHRLDLSTKNPKFAHIPRDGVVLNAVRVGFSASSFSLHVEEGAGGDREARQEEVGRDWLLRRRGADLHGLARVPNPSVPFGRPTSVPVQENLRILAARLKELVAAHFEDRDTVEGRDLSFLGKDLLKDALDHVRAPDVAYGFSVRTRFDFETRLVDPNAEGVFVALVLRQRTKWDADVDLLALESAGVDLQGLYVVRRERGEEEARVAGRIERLEGARVVLSDSPDGLDSIAASDVTLEPRRDAFARVMGRVLSPIQQGKLEKRRDELQGKELDGEAVVRVLEQTRNYLRNVEGGFVIQEGLRATIGSHVVISNSGRHTSVVRSGPVSYYFDPGRSKKDTWAWRGLTTYGPFDQESFPRREPRVLFVCTDRAKGSVEQFAKALLDGAGDKRAFPGLRSTFRLPNVDVDFCVVPSEGTGRKPPGTAYQDAIEHHLRSKGVGPRPAYDSAIVAVHDEHAALAPERNPYLCSKALLLQNAIPVQQARLTTVRGRNPNAYQNIATALYAKMSGTPWTVAQDGTVSHELVIGLGLSEQGGRFGPRKRLVGITTVFEGDGNYLLGYIAEQCAYEDYPEKLRASTLHVLREEKRKRGWRPGETVRIVFHSYKRLKDVEVAQIVADCVEEVGDEQNVEFAFLTVTREHPYTLLDVHQQGVPAWKGSDKLKAVHLPPRGLIARVKRSERLVATLGEKQTRPGEPLKRPVLVKLHRASTFKDLTYLSEQVLKFSSLSWRTVRPVKMPVTIRYSKHIADQLGELSKLESWSPAALNTRLGTSLWFL